MPVYKHGKTGQRVRTIPGSPEDRLLSKDRAWRKHNPSGHLAEQNTAGTTADTTAEPDTQDETEES